MLSRRRQPLQAFQKYFISLKFSNFLFKKSSANSLTNQSCNCFQNRYSLGNTKRWRLNRIRYEKNRLSGFFFSTHPVLTTNIFVSLSKYFYCEYQWLVPSSRLKGGGLQLQYIAWAKIVRSSEGPFLSPYFLWHSQYPACALLLSVSRIFTFIS